MLKKYRIEIIIFYVLAALSLAFAAFYDLKIDIRLNDPDNIFANWFYRTGEMPARLLCPIAGALIVFCADKVWQKIIGGAICIGGSAYFGYYFGKYFFNDTYKMPYSIIFGVGFGLVLLFACSFVHIPDNYKMPLLQACVVGLAVLVLQLSTVEVMKNLWGRVRYRDLLNDVTLDRFTPFYVINGKNGNKSFPSGHTAGAGMIYLSMLLPMINEKLKKYKSLFFTVSIVYTSVVAFTRLVMGAHYLSDVTVGGIIAFTYVIIGLKVYEKVTEKTGYAINN